nr:hypothetical protein HAGR004_19530 [Bdellovibrio sp. HAGR004]
MSDNNQKRDEVSTQSIVILLICFFIWGVAKNIDKIESWAKAHWFILSLALAAIIWGAKSFLNWKLRMKHPEMYERQMALEKMKRKEKYDE